MSLDTGKARLPGLPAVTTGNATLDKWIQAVAERLEVREGARGNAAERVVTMRDLKGLGLTQTSMSAATGVGGAGGDIVVAKPDGTFARISVDAFSESIRKTKIYHELTTSLNDPNRYGDIPEAVRALLLSSLTDEAAARGADIRRLELKQQSASESLAYTVDTVTAAVQDAAAGVRDVTYAYAKADSAIAGRVLKIQSRINHFSPDGAPGTATIEQNFKAVADRTTGLEASYFLKVQVDAFGKRKIAGFGVSAAADPTGALSSAFIVLADKFAIVTGSDNITDPLNPPADRIPFGVDSSGVYINGQVRINASGQTIESVSRAITLSSTSSVFNVASSGAAAPSSVTLTAALLNGLTGTPTFTVISGTATLTGSGLTRALAYSGMTTDRVIVRASVTTSGVTYNADILIYKAYDGATGSAGTRGSVTRYGTLVGGASWNSTDIATANGLVGTPQVIGDTVTLSSSTTAITKYWGGSSWLDPGVVIDGNLLVNGTVSATRLAAGAIVAGSLTLTTAAYVTGSVSMSSGVGTVSYYHYAGRNVVGMISASPPSGYGIVSGIITYADTNRTDITFSVFTNAGVGYTGSMTAQFAYL